MDGRRVVLVFLLVGAAAMTASAQQSYRWEILMSGAPVGDEQGSWTGSRLEARTAFEVSAGGGQKVKLQLSHTLELDPSGLLRSYAADLEVAGQRSRVQASVRDGSAELSASSGGRVLGTQSFPCDSDTVLLDNNIVGHYFQLWRFLDPEGPGQRKLRILVPQVLSAISARAVRQPGRWSWKLGERSGTAVKWELDVAGQPILAYQDVLSLEIVQVEVPAARVLYRPAGIEFSTLEAATVARPAYLQSSGVRERELSIRVGNLEIGATLAGPAAATKPLPGVLLLSGSGPNDRDETVGGMKPFRDIAHGLANAGYVVLRYDKRSYAYRERIEELGDIGSMTVLDEYVPDAAAALQLLAGQEGVDATRLVLVGHSLGGWVLPYVWEALGERQAGVRALVYLAPGGRDMGAVLVRQLEYKRSITGESASLDALIADVRGKVTALRAGREVQGGIFGATAYYWRDMLERDPALRAREMSLPMLFVRGEKDYQVTEEEMQGWSAAARPGTVREFRTLPGLNHLFGAVEGQSTGAEYFREGYVSPELVEFLASWIAQTVGR